MTKSKLNPVAADAISTTPTGPTFEEGLIVGLLMARGSFTGDKKCGRLSILSTDHEMLLWIKSRIKGSISGPYHQAGRSSHYMYQLSGPSLHPVIEILSTHMPTGNQRTRYLAWLAKYSAYGMRVAP